MISPQIQLLLEDLYTTLLSRGLGVQRRAEKLARIKSDPEAFLASVLIQAKKKIEESYFSPTLEGALETAAYDEHVNQARALLNEAVTEETPAMTSA